MILPGHSGQSGLPAPERHQGVCTPSQLLNHVKPHINCVILSCIFLFSFPPTAAMPKALWPKTLRPPPTRSAQKRCRGPCKLCNNLDPRGHTATEYDAESNSRAGANLTLVVDGLKLQSTAEFGCKFCLLVAQALDTFLKDWRASRGRITIDLVEGKPIKVSIGGIKCNGVSLEIYAPHGRTFLSH